jgi:hypothetical protein
MRRAVVATAALLVAGCCCFMFQCDPYTGDYARTAPASGDIVGVWKANAKSLAWLKEQGYGPAALPTLEFRADGAFTMAGMPDCWLTPFVRPGGSLTSGSGTWKVAKHQEWWAVALDFQRPSWFEKGDYYTDFMIRHQKPPYLVHVIVGDPDAGHGIEFEKE